MKERGGLVKRGAVLLWSVYGGRGGAAGALGKVSHAALGTELQVMAILLTPSSAPSK